VEALFEKQPAFHHANVLPDHRSEKVRAGTVITRRRFPSRECFELTRFNSKNVSSGLLPGIYAGI
jgi:hypothetical protein